MRFGRGRDLLSSIGMQAVGGSDRYSYARGPVVRPDVPDVHCWATTRDHTDHFGLQFRSPNGYPALETIRGELAAAGFEYYHENLNSEEERMAKGDPVEYVRMTGSSDLAPETAELRLLQRACERFVDIAAERL